MTRRLVNTFTALVCLWRKSRGQWDDHLRGEQGGTVVVSHAPSFGEHQPYKD